MLLLLLSGCGPTDKDSASPDPNAPPEAPIVAITPADPTTEDVLQGVIQGGGSDPDGDPVAFTWAWFVDGADAGLATETVDPAATTKGETWRVVVTPNDGALDGEAAFAEVTVVNSAPTASLSVAPEVPTTADAVVATAEVVDADEDAVSLTWSWTVDGVDAGLDSPDLPAGTHVRGQTWEVTAVPNDGEVDGAPATTSFTVANAPPTLGAVVLDLDAPTVTDTLTATFVDAADADGDGVSVQVAWRVDGVEVATEEVAADGSTSLAGLWVKGQTVGVVATPWDGYELGVPVEIEVIAADSPPSATGATISPSPLTTADDASCTGEGWTDADGDAAGWRTTWTVNGVEVSTDPTLAAGTHVRGDVVGCTLVPDDGELTGAAVSAAEVTVTNAAPTCAKVGVAIGPDPATIADTLAVTSETSSGCADADGDTLTRVYDWQVDGVTAGSGATLAGAFDRGDGVTLTVAWSDGTTTGGTVTSNTVAIVNDPPVATSVTLSPSPATTDDTLSVVLAASDLEGDPVDWTYAWTVDGTSAGSGSTLGDTAFVKGQTVAVTVTPNDGYDDGTPATTSLTIQNSAPTAPTVAISPATPEDADALVCTVSAAATDADGDSLSYSFAWSVGGIAYTSTTTTTFAGDTVPASATTNGQEWTCTVTATDGTDATEGTDSATVGCDRDGDGYDDVACGGTDCADSDASRNPGASEICDASDVDEDCDGLADDADPSLTGTTWYPDADGDGYGAADAGVVACARPSGYLSTGDDCDDTSNQIRPGGTERCDSADVDEDCDGLADDADVNPSGRSYQYPDADGDGYGDETASSTYACPTLPGYTTNRSDCDDGDGAVSPAEEEVCDDGIDNNCDEQPYPCGLEGTGDETDAYYTAYSYNNTFGGDLATGDFNGDGDRDWAGTSYTYDRFHMYFGTFSAGSVTESDDDVRVNVAQDWGLEIEGVGDVDDDGDDDILVVAQGNTSSVYLLDGDPALSDTTLTSAGALTSFGYYGEGAAGGDFDDDGVADLWVADIGLSTTSETDYLYFYAGDAAGPSLAATWTNASGYFGNTLLGDQDWDGDGVVDLFFTSYATISGVFFLEGGPAPTGTALTAAADAWITASSTNWYVRDVGDVDGDGWLDLGVVVSTSSSRLYFFQGPPSGTGLTLGDALGYGAGADASHGDLDADGVEELVVSDTSYVNVYPLPLSSGSLGAATATIDLSGYYSFYTAEPEARYDFTGDGIVDLLFGGETGSTPQYVLLFTGGNP